MVNRVLPIIAFLLLFACLWLTFSYPSSFNISDGGYLWTGSWRTYLGESPKLDFRSYDPLRYWWTSAFIAGWGNAWFTVVVASLIFFLLALGLLIFQGQRFIGRADGVSFAGIIAVILIGILELFWLFPAHKIFDHAASLVSCSVLFFLFTQHSIKTRYFVLGLGFGVIALIGRNHLLYLTLSMFLIILIGNKIHELRTNALKMLLLGGALAYSPMLIMFIVNDGFLASYFINSIVGVATRASSNLQLPLYLPWQFTWGEGSLGTGQFWLSLALFYTCFIYFVNVVDLLFSYVGGKKRELDFVVPMVFCIVGIFYLHHVFARADFSHLAQSIQPIIFLLIVRVCFSSKVVFSWLLLVPFLIISMFASFHNNPAFVSRTSSESFETYSGPRGEQYLLDLTTKRNLVKFDKWVATYGEDMAFLPNIAAAYAHFGIAPKVSNIYMIWRESEPQQQREISNLAEREYIVLGEIAYDGRPETMLHNTNQHIYRFIIENYCVIDKQEPYYLYKKCEK